MHVLPASNEFGLCAEHYAEIISGPIYACDHCTYVSSSDDTFGSHMAFCHPDETQAEPPAAA
jgi:hypothetical protein